MYCLISKHSVIFPVTFILLILSLIPLWLENILYDFNSLKFVKICCGLFWQMFKCIWNNICTLQLLAVVVCMSVKLRRFIVQIFWIFTYSAYYILIIFLVPSAISVNYCNISKNDCEFVSLYIRWHKFKNVFSSYLMDSFIILTYVSISHNTWSLFCLVLMKLYEHSFV